MRSRWVHRPTVALVCCACLSAYFGRDALAADPPKTIIDIGTSPLCTTLRESVIPAIVGLQANDALISAGRRQLSQWSTDAWREGPRGGFWRMDRMRVENVVGSIVRNLNVLDGILNDPKRFPHDKTGSSASAAALHDQLQAVADGQRKTLNDLYGPVDNSMMSEMMQLPDRTIATKAFSKVPAEINDVGRSVGQFVTLGGTSNYTMDDAPTLSNNLPAQPATEVLPTPPAGTLEAQQVQIAQSESTASQLIQRAVEQCKKAVTPSPHP